MQRNMMRLLAGVAILALPIAANATTTFGSLGNFDAVNDTGSIAHGFEIELEGIHASNVTDTFGGAGRGFPTTVKPMVRRPSRNTAMAASSAFVSPTVPI